MQQVTFRCKDNYMYNLFIDREDEVRKVAHPQDICMCIL